MDKYYLIYSGEDGVSVEEMSQEDLNERFGNPDDPYYGSRATFADKVESINPGYWTNSILLIKGKIIVPKAVEKVTKYEF